MRRTSLLIDDDVFLAARAHADQRGVSFGSVVTEALREYLELGGARPPLPFTGIGASGVAWDAESLDRMLTEGTDPVEGFKYPLPSRARPRSRVAESRG
jgi:hypothetical protein